MSIHPIASKSIANPGPIHHPSIADPLPIRCQFSKSCANLLPFLCQSDVNHRPIQCQSCPIQGQSIFNLLPLQSSANHVPIRCQSSSNMRPIQRQSKFHLMPILCKQRPIHRRVPCLLLSHQTPPPPILLLHQEPQAGHLFLQVRCKSFHGFASPFMRFQCDFVLLSLTSIQSHIPDYSNFVIVILFVFPQHILILQSGVFVHFSLCQFVNQLCHQSRTVFI